MVETMLNKQFVMEVFLWTSKVSKNVKKETSNLHNKKMQMLSKSQISQIFNLENNIRKYVIVCLTSLACFSYDLWCFRTWRG